MKKKVMALVMVAAVASMMAVGCGSTKKETEKATEAATTAATEAATTAAAPEVRTEKALPPAGMPRSGSGDPGGGRPQPGEDARRGRQRGDKTEGRQFPALYKAFFHRSAPFPRVGGSS